MKPSPSETTMESFSVRQIVFGQRSWCPITRNQSESPGCPTAGIVVKLRVSTLSPGGPEVTAVKLSGVNARVPVDSAVQVRTKQPSASLGERGIGERVPATQAAPKREAARMMVRRWHLTMAAIRKGGAT